MLTGKEVLTYLSIKHSGDWGEIYKAITTKERIDPEETVLKELGKVKSKIVTIIDDDYPEVLKGIYRPPFVLFYYGDLSLACKTQCNLAVVGSRYAMEKNIQATKNIVADICGQYNIISGLAYGIDAAAFESAIDHSGKTIGVLGGGIDYVYPRANLELYNITKENGLLISEYPNGIQPEASNFPFRNRIIAALATAVFIPEIKEKSGTYSTLCHALSFGKDVFVLVQPSNTHNMNNRLIKDGAYLVENGADIIDELKK